MSISISQKRNMNGDPMDETPPGVVLLVPKGREWFTPGPVSEKALSQWGLTTYVVVSWDGEDGAGLFPALEKVGAPYVWVPLGQALSHFVLMALVKRDLEGLWTPHLLVQLETEDLTVIDHSLNRTVQVASAGAVSESR